MKEILYTVWFVPTERAKKELPSWVERQIEGPVDHEYASAVVHELRAENMSSDFGLFGRYEIRPAVTAKNQVQ